MRSRRLACWAAKATMMVAVEERPSMNANTRLLVTGLRDGLPELAIPGRGHADFSLEGFVKGDSRFIAEKLCDLFDLDMVLEQAGCSVHAPMREIRDRGLTHQTGKASGED